ncbi:MAG: hypothetical protein CXZ00_08460 [Acidobacteria bacterium]|nr:MAG: hypothetical protein CXZ00_08460 [Acidobacteriota bacterium]
MHLRWRRADPENTDLKAGQDAGTSARPEKTAPNVCNGVVSLLRLLMDSSRGILADAAKKVHAQAGKCTMARS